MRLIAIHAGEVVVALRPGEMLEFARGAGLGDVANRLRACPAALFAVLGGELAYVPGLSAEELIPRDDGRTLLLLPAGEAHVARDRRILAATMRLLIARRPQAR